MKPKSIALLLLSLLLLLLLLPTSVCAAALLEALEMDRSSFPGTLAPLFTPTLIFLSFPTAVTQSKSDQKPTFGRREFNFACTVENL